MSVTVVVRWVPGLTVRCGTRVARPSEDECGWPHSVAPGRNVFKKALVEGLGATYSPRSCTGLDCHSPRRGYRLHRLPQAPPQCPDRRCAPRDYRSASWGPCGG